MAKIILSAQNFDIYEGNELDLFARTGATSSEQLFRAGAEGVIIGHSETGDGPEIVRQKLLTVFKKQPAHGPNFLSKSTVLFGESWEEFDGKTPEEVAETIKLRTGFILKDFPPAFVKNLVLGYEPKWGSRGSGRDDMPPPQPEFISACAKEIKAQLKADFDQKTSEIPIIYGGRSTPERTEQILSDDNVEGLILGSACNTIGKTLAIAKVIQKMRRNKRKILHANFKAYNLAESYEDYLKALRKLDDGFKIYVSPPHTDIYQLKTLLGSKT